MCQINPMSEFRGIIAAGQKMCLPRDTRHLWLTLFTCANERQKMNPATGAWEWPDDFFPVSVDELRLKSDIERRAILKARAILKEMGFIDFIPGEGNCRPARYKINYLTACRYKSVPDPVPESAPVHAYVPESAPDHVPDHVPDPAPDPVPESVPESVPQLVPIYKDIDIDKDTEKEEDNGETEDDDDDDNMLSPDTRVREGACTRTRMRVCAREDPHSGHSENPIYPPYPPPYPAFPYGRSPPFMGKHESA